jgi:hypothetical protein
MDSSSNTQLKSDGSFSEAKGPRCGIEPLLDMCGSSNVQRIVVVF